MRDPANELTPANPDDLAAALAFALRFQGRKRVHNADEMMSAIVRQAPSGAPRAVGIRRHEEAADQRGGGAWPWPRWPMMLSWLRGGARPHGWRKPPPRR